MARRAILKEAVLGPPLEQPLSALPLDPPVARSTAARVRAAVRRYAPRLFLAVGVTLAMLKLADAVVGRVANTRERHMLRLRPGAEVRHKSNEFDYVFRTNKLGLRGPDIPFAKPAGTYRTVVLGDSMLAGFGVSDEELLTTHL